MNTVEALKELYKSFGGKLTDTYDDIADGIPVGNYSVIPDCFAALAEIAGGSIELPVVTQADAGDVLTVGEDGKWTNAEPAKELPSVTASDNGSVLSVVDGAWAKGLKIKKKTVTFEGGQSTVKIGMASGDYTSHFVIGYRLSKDSIEKLPNFSDVSMGYNTPYTYGQTTVQAVLTLKVQGVETAFPEGTYTLEVYYIEP